MAIDISPLYKVIREQIPCEIYDGNFTFTPMDPSELSVYFTLTSSKFLSGPKIERKEANSDKLITEVWSRMVEYIYQLDIYRYIPIENPQLSIAPEFEIEAFTVIDSINSQSPRLAREHKLGVCALNNINFSMEMYPIDTPVHRATCTFSILAESVVKFSSNTSRIKCINPQIKKIGDSS